MTDQGVLNREELIGEATVTFYAEQFREVSWDKDDSMLQYIPKLIIDVTLRILHVLVLCRRNMI